MISPPAIGCGRGLLYLLDNGVLGFSRISGWKAHQLLQSRPTPTGAAHEGGLGKCSGDFKTLSRPEQ